MEELHGMETRPARISAILIMDYLMKWASIRYHESSLYFYRKHGISWCDVVVLLHHKKKEEEVSVDLKTLVMGHLLIKGNLKMYRVVISIFYAVLEQWDSKFRRVTSLSVMTDKTRNYEDSVVPLVTFFTYIAHRISLDSLVHPQSGRGKRILDAHFSVCMGHVLLYV